MLTDLELMRLHAEAEFTQDAAGRLVSTNESAAVPAPRFFLGHTALGVIRRYRHAVSDARRRALEAAVAAAELETRMAATDTPLDPTPFEHILSEDAPIQHTSVGLAFRFRMPCRRSPAYVFCAASKTRRCCTRYSPPGRPTHSRRRHL